MCSSDLVDRARLALRPSVNAGAVIEAFGKAPFPDIDVGALVAVLSEGINDIHGGDLKRCESMLYAQANALQTVFMSLARRAANCDYLNQHQTYMNLALRAQNQSRMTLETLATIKNPPVFARQANIAHTQQVNNGTPQIGRAHV